MCVYATAGSDPGPRKEEPPKLTRFLPSGRVVVGMQRPSGVLSSPEHCGGPAAAGVAQDPRSVPHGRPGAGGDRREVQASLVTGERVAVRFPLCFKRFPTLVSSGQLGARCERLFVLRLWKDGSVACFQY